MIKIEKENLQKAYREGCSDIKKALENLFGREAIASDWISLFNDFCKKNKLDSEDILPYRSPQNKKQESQNSFAMLIEIVKVANDGWVADYSDSNQLKYEPRFYYDKTSSGFGFSYSDFDGWNSMTTVGSRLCFKDDNTCANTAKEYFPIYNVFLTNN